MSDPAASAPFYFLFSIDRLSAASPAYYHGPALAELLDAVLAEGDSGTSFKVYCGDALWYRAAARLSAIRSGEVHISAGRRTRYRESVDPELWQTLIWDICDSIGHDWTTLDPAALPGHIASGDIFAVGVSALPLEVAEAIDRRLKGLPAYLGAFVADPGNPLHTLEALALLHQCDYQGRALYFDPWETDSPEDPYPLHRDGTWWRDLPFQALHYADGSRDTGPAWPEGPLSDRGALTAQVLAQRAKPSHTERLIESIRTLSSREIPADFAVDVDAVPRAGEAIVEESKLAGYALDPNHPVGRHKARVFRETLAIEASDSAFLADQLRVGLAHATVLDRVRIDNYGAKFHVVLPITGRNGAVRPVIAAWEVRSGGSPRLTTVYVAEKGIEIQDLALPSPRVLPTELEGDARWSALWELADAEGQRAANDLITTPMLVGTEWVPEVSLGRPGWLSTTRALASPDGSRETEKLTSSGARGLSFRPPRPSSSRGPGRMRRPLPRYWRRMGCR